MINTKFRLISGARAFGGFTFAAVVALATFASHEVHAQAAGDYAKGRIVVMPRAGVSDDALSATLAGHGGKARRIGKTGLHIVDVPAGAEVAVRNALARNPQFKFAELDKRFNLAMTTNDPYAGSAWHLSKIGAGTAWDTATGNGVTIAVLDTGVDGTHPDLSSQMVAGWNFADNNSNASDIHGHGTAVAGAAAAAFNNGVGVASVAGAAKIMPIRVTDSTGYAYGSTIAQALSYAADNGARVANVSIDGLVGNSTVESAAQYMKSKGGLVVVAAGNSGTNLGVGPTNTMIPVSATDANDLITSWSSFGNHVAVSAPGLNIWTTQRGGTYGQWWGTSFSSPVAAGVVALMMSLRPDLSNAQVESLLYSSATDLGAAGRDIYYGYGRVNASAAVAAAKSAAAGDTVAPSVAINSPASSTTVNGLVAVDVGATDNVGVAKVELRINGNLIATDTASPYQFSWDSSKAANGTYNLQATAYDAAGNSASSGLVALTVANAVVVDTTPPTVAITNPGNGAKISGASVTIAVSAADNSGAAGLKNVLFIDGVQVASNTGGSLSYKWNTRKLKAGTHSVSAQSQDAAGNKTTTSIQVTY